MGKSKLNVVNPDDVVKEYGADTLRLYEMYMGPLEQAKPWQTEGTKGMYRFLGRAYRLLLNGEGGMSEKVVDAEPSKAVLKLTHATIKKVGEELDGMRFNTGISALIEMVNALYKEKTVPRSVATTFAQLLAPFAPHLGEEIWEALGNETTITYDELQFANR